MPSCVEGEGSIEKEVGSNIGANVEGVGAEEEEGGACTVEGEGQQGQGSEVGKGYSGYFIMTTCLNVVKDEAEYSSNQSIQ